MEGKHYETLNRKNNFCGILDSLDNVNLRVEASRTDCGFFKAKRDRP